MREIDLSSPKWHKISEQYNPKIKYETGPGLTFDLIRPTVGRFYNIVGFILAFGSPLYHPVSKGGSVNIFSGNILTPLYFERFFVKLKYN